MSTTGRDYWVAEVGQYGYAHELCDGPHSELLGAIKALRLIHELGLDFGRELCCVRVDRIDVADFRSTRDVRSD